MFAIVTHNAVGTVHSLIRGFESIEEAQAYRVRYAYTGVIDCPIIRQEDEPKVWAINSRWHHDNPYVA